MGAGQIDESLSGFKEPGEFSHSLRELKNLGGKVHPVKEPGEFSHSYAGLKNLGGKAHPVLRSLQSSVTH